MKTPSRQFPPLFVRRALFLVFTISGFAGLIYESIWSHYLKLLLGHAAYAQTLVLVLFMGGMAIGSWLSGRMSSRIRNPLLAYAAVELVLGIFGLLFDTIFRSASDFVLLTAAPALADPLPIEALKWGTSALLILPPCILLGATFPLISAGVVRIRPQEAGNALGWLYFTNSLGAVVGVLTSGFVLIAWIGLPGTLLTAALCNFTLALVVWILGRRSSSPVSPPGENRIPVANAPDVTARVLYAAAFLTGAASFFYEIGWIRMLSLVLGSATHSFELMLGAFILGLALGALYVRNRLDTIGDPVRFLAWVQVIMGTVALCTLIVYGWSFDWMAGMVRTLAKNETGFLWFNVLSQGICVALMLPVTFFAGMTLPAITTLVLRTAAGESAIGRVYSANTWGAIAAVIVAVHFVMPVLGLRNVVVTGAAIDLGLGLWLLTRAAGSSSGLERLVALGAMVICVSIAAFVRFDASRLSSGVYRHGYAQRIPPNIFHRDGRTATIDVSRKGGSTSIITNGKPDAALSVDGATQDDYTMILTGALPLAMRPDAKDIAIVGMGSGRSTHVLLGSPVVRNVDTIEIEPAMIEGARLFGPLTAKAFTDPRSHLHVEDAKTFFARHQKKYDIIMSEPSNPWVSGVASLFSVEFYRQVKNYIAPGGIFVQWLQLYEFDDSLVATVGAALDSQFGDYAIYAADNSNILIVAVPSGTLPRPSAQFLGWPEVGALSHLIGINSLADVQVRWLGDRATIGPLFQNSAAPPNSDYFPYLDQHAARFRFMQSVATLLSGGQAVTHRLAAVQEEISYGSVTPMSELSASLRASDATALATYLRWRRGDGTPPSGPLPAQAIATGVALGRIAESCEAQETIAVWIPAIERVGEELWPFLDQGAALEIVRELRNNKCSGAISGRVNRWIDFMEAVAKRDWAMVSEIGAQLVAEGNILHLQPSAFVLRELLLADYHRFGLPGLKTRFDLVGNNLPEDGSIKLLRALVNG